MPVSAPTARPPRIGTSHTVRRPRPSALAHAPSAPASVNAAGAPTGAP